MGAKRLVYVIAGEASGDAIGRKLIQALQRHPKGPFEFRGVGGPQMTEAGHFKSLFPMQDLSVMGLVEVIPKIFVFRRRLAHVVEDILKHKPDAIVTIDSKGFNFRVMRTLNDQQPELRSKTAFVHYVAPSIWAYRHKYRNAPAISKSLRQLMDRMLVILPFEASLFANGGEKWATFVGHPAVEEFMERHGLFCPHKLSSGESTELPGNKWLQQDPSSPLAATQAQVFHSAITTNNVKDRPSNTYTICALLGSRENEVSKSIDLIKQAIDDFAKRNDCKPHVLFPTIQALEGQLQSNLKDWDHPWSIHVKGDKTALFEASDVSIAVSGTVVIESILAGTPTVVIYRANRLTELIATALARVNYVTLPNILAEKEIVPELIFSRCTRSNLVAALSEHYQGGHKATKSKLLSYTLSQLAPWVSDSVSTTPRRASDLAAEAIVEEMEAKR